MSTLSGVDQAMFYRDYVDDASELQPYVGEPAVYIDGPPIVIAINRIAAELLDVVGSAAWAALVLLYVFNFFSSWTY